MVEKEYINFIACYQMIWATARQLSTIYPCNSFFKIFQALKAHLEPLLLCEMH
jgi:hypothetical protein